MFKKTLVLILILSLILITMMKLSNNTEQIMKYFPIDEEEQFENASTSMSISLKNDNINWQLRSKTSNPQYLRQDVSLLYENGLFKGVQQKWQQNVAKVKLEKTFPITKTAPSKLSAISFHHAEIHHNEDIITSIQKMTSNQLYLIKENAHIRSFQEPKSKPELLLINEINDTNKKNLMMVWNSWMAKFQIKPEQYTLIPLVDLIHYEGHPLGNLSIDQTEKLIGQLWEGLYDNYIISLIDGQEKNHHPMPIILLAKDDSHLIILYEINNKNQKLIQKIS